MTPLSKTVFESYQVRKTKKQKDAFIALMQEHFPDMQVQEGGFAKSRNLVLGDVESAQVLLGAHYDTCARMPFPNFITPTKPAISIAYGFVIAIPILAVMFLSRALVGLFTDDEMTIYWVSLLSVYACLVLMMVGPANKHTANDNTSGVITLIELYETMTPEEREKVAFIFFDNEEMGLLGSGYFRKLYKGKLDEKLMLNYDCVSDGDNIMLVMSKDAREVCERDVKESFLDTGKKKMLFAKSEKTYYPSDQKGFKRHIALNALKENKLFYYMDRIHTSRDTAFDEENISLIVDSTKKLIDRVTE